MSESYEEKEVRKPFLKKSEQQDEKVNRRRPIIQSSNRDILSAMPQDAVQVIAAQLYNKRGEDGKVAPSKDVAHLKAASRHFYGKTPDVTECFPNTRKYPERAIRFFTCELGLAVLDVGKGPDYRDPGEVNRYEDYCVAASMCYVCLPISISAGVIGGLVGCVTDTRNAVNSVRIRGNRPQEPEHHYITVPLSDPKLPPSQAMK